MDDNNIPELPAPAPTPTLRWCANRTHLVDREKSHGRCKPCNRQTPLLSKARSTGAKICENGHGLVQRNLAADGSCNECADVEAVIADPTSPIRPAPSTWLDWGAVAAALDGRALLRPLSLREVACLLTTLQDRCPERSFRAMIEWVADCTAVKVSEPYATYILNQWWCRLGLPDPRITLEQAVYAECDGDAWIAEAAQARKDAA